MYRIIIKNLNNVRIGTIEDASQEEALRLFNLEREAGSFGKDEWVEIAYNKDEEPIGSVTHPAQFTYTVEDISVEVAKENLKQEMIAKGVKTRKVCQDCLDFIAGYNLDRELSAAQVTQMQQTFGTIEAYLKANRPYSARPLIEALVPNGELITVEMKETVLAILSEV